MVREKFKVRLTSEERDQAERSVMNDRFLKMLAVSLSKRLTMSVMAISATAAPAIMGPVLVPAIRLKQSAIFVPRDCSTLAGRWAA